MFISGIPNRVTLLNERRNLKKAPLSTKSTLPQRTWNEQFEKKAAAGIHFAPECDIQLNSSDRQSRKFVH